MPKAQKGGLDSFAKQTKVPASYEYVQSPGLGLVPNADNLKEGVFLIAPSKKRKIDKYFNTRSSKELPYQEWKLENKIVDHCKF